MISLKYIAGLFDADGYVGISNWCNGKSFILKCSVSNTDLNILELIQKDYGGRINVNVIKNKNHSHQFSLNFNGDDTFTFLNLILPYTVIKHDQIELALTFPRNMDRSYLTNDVKSKRLSIYNKLKKMKYGTTIPPNSMLSDEYMAGFFDGDGYVGIVKWSNGIHYLLRSSLTNINTEFLNLVQKEYGGNIYAKSLANVKYDGQYYIMFYGVNAKEFIHKILKFTFVKKKQIQVALDFPINQHNIGFNERQKEQRMIFEKLKKLKKPKRFIPDRLIGTREKEHESYLNKKNEAIKLRKLGWSYQKISDDIGVSKTMVYKYITK